MDLLTPFDLVAEFEERQSVVIVGNAPTLAGSHLGEWIDSHDIVVRFNDCRVFEHEQDVGSRTEILVCNPYAETRPNRRVGDAVSPRLVVAISSLTRRGHKEEFERWVGDYPVLFTYSPDIRINCGDRRSIALTTGTYGLVLIEKLLRPESLSVTGFTMFRPGTDFHYWSSTPPPGIKSHAPAAEANIFTDILNSFKCQVTVTEEVANIFKTSGKKPGPKIHSYKKRFSFRSVL